MGPVKNGLAHGKQRDFDAVRGGRHGELFEFIGATQIDAWNRLVKLRGGDPDAAHAKFAGRRAKQPDSFGTIEVLRTGSIPPTLAEWSMTT